MTDSAWFVSTRRTAFAAALDSDPCARGRAAAGVGYRGRFNEHDVAPRTEERLAETRRQDRTRNAPDANRRRGGQPRQRGARRWYGARPGKSRRGMSRDADFFSLVSQTGRYRRSCVYSYLGLSTNGSVDPLVAGSNPARPTFYKIRATSARWRDTWPPRPCRSLPRPARTRGRGGGPTAASMWPAP